MGILFAIVLPPSAVLLCIAVVALLDCRRQLERIADALEGRGSRVDVWEVRGD